MKTTMSRDGERRTNLRVEFRLGKDEVANLLAISVQMYGDEREELSEKKLLDVVKKQLFNQGLDVLEFGADTAPDDETVEWAREQVEKFWK